MAHQTASSCNRRCSQPNLAASRPQDLDAHTSVLCQSERRHWNLVFQKRGLLAVCLQFRPLCTCGEKRWGRPPKYLSEVLTCDAPPPQISISSRPGERTKSWVRQLTRRHQDAGIKPRVCRFRAKAKTWFRKTCQSKAITRLQVSRCLASCH